MFLLQMTSWALLYLLLHGLTEVIAVSATLGRSFSCSVFFISDDCSVENSHDVLLKLSFTVHKGIYHWITLPFLLPLYHIHTVIVWL